MVRRALEEPLRRIVKNTDVEVSKSLYTIKQNSGAFGFNAQNFQYENLLKAGIPDAVKMCRIALETAASIAEDTKDARKL